jgi:dTDP-4-dehydrorhamnose reductase
MDILVVGGGGQVGTELCRLDWPPGVAVYAPSRQALDVTDEAAVDAIIAGQDFAAAINVAAYTAVDRAESGVAAAWRLNALAPALLAAATRRRGVPLIHVSTDYVFDGTLDRAYVETDAVAPLGVYGASKEGGEQAVRTANPRHAIIRTAWVVSAHRANFVKTMLRLARERELLRVVDDQLGCPTAAKDLASVLATMALRFARDPRAPTGTYHAVNAGETSWCGFAREILAQAEARGAPHAPVEAVPTSAFPTRARRPANSRLRTTKLANEFGIRLRPWQESLSDILDELLGPVTRNIS